MTHMQTLISSMKRQLSIIGSRKVLQVECQTGARCTTIIQTVIMIIHIAQIELLTSMQGDINTTWINHNVTSRTLQTQLEDLCKTNLETQTISWRSLWTTIPEKTQVFKVMCLLLLTVLGTTWLQTIPILTWLKDLQLWKLQLLKQILIQILS